MVRKVTAVRQGDVLLVPVSADQRKEGMRTVKPVNSRYILAEGEVTGHHHSVPANAYTALLSDGIATILEVERTAKFAHQEHSALTLPPADYEVILQRRARAGSAETKVLRAYD